MTLADGLIKIDEFLLDRVFQPLTDRLGEQPSAFDVGISLELGAVVLELAAGCGTGSAAPAACGSMCSWCASGRW
jgi:hypothetical protein